ncbi:hypothetical protein PHJA_002951100, partial [Phtheirospermum japonicum]
HFLGEDLGNFGPKELDQIECILDASLKKIRSKQEKNLVEVNMVLKTNLKELVLQYQKHGIKGKARHYTGPSLRRPKVFSSPLNATTQNKFAAYPYLSSAFAYKFQRAKSNEDASSSTIHARAQKEHHTIKFSKYGGGELNKSNTQSRQSSYPSPYHHYEVKDGSAELRASIEKNKNK